ncbi:MAG: HEAT repeat domain-containing protein [Phenylobacterium sp.]|nr:MAG: HEAT repeat domain-containing protein [Phenylobacterium sp.]
MPLIRKPSTPPTAAAAAAGQTAAALVSGTADERWAAARSLATPEGVAALGEALAAEGDPRVREAILTSLARVASTDSAQAVIPYIRSDDAALRTGALDALRAMPQAVAESLPGLLSDPDPDVRLLACELVREVPGAEATRLLATLLDGEAESNVCAAAVDVLAEVGGPECLPALARCAERFGHEPFLGFAIKVASERIGAQAADRLG